jgi:predicted secreted protein
MKTFKPGESIAVRVAEEFELCLPVLAAAGYEWQVVEKTTGLVVFESSFQVPTDARIGGASQQILRFRADRPGAFTLRLVCKRAWEEAPSETLNVQVSVQGHK